MIESRVGEATQGELAKVALKAGLAAAVIEMIPVLLIQGMMGVSVTRVFQSISTGLLGRDAYSGGMATALLGVALHTFISIVAAAVFVAAVRMKPALLRRPVISGLLYGVVVYLVMTFIVVPLSAVAYAPNRNPVMMGMSLVVHMLTFGLPIALVCWREFKAKRLPTGSAVPA